MMKNVCPECDSQRLEEANMSEDDESIYLEYACLECQSSWTNVYELIDQVDIHNPNSQ